MQWLRTADPKSSIRPSCFPLPPPDSYLSRFEDTISLSPREPRLVPFFIGVALELDVFLWTFSLDSLVPLSPKFSQDVPEVMEAP